MKWKDRSKGKSDFWAIYILKLFKDIERKDEIISQTPQITHVERPLKHPSIPIVLDGKTVQLSKDYRCH